ncbi:hypothetical protein ACFX2J_000342 [Malus domestica]
MPDQILISLVPELAFSFDSPIVGVTLAYAAVRTLQKFSSYSSALRKIHNAPSVKVSNVRSIIAFDQLGQSDAKLVIVRGTVEAKSVFHGRWNVFKSGVVPPQGTKAVLVHRSQMFRFILVDRGGARKSSSGFVSVNVDGSRHPLPLTTVYRYVHPVDASPYSSLKTHFGHEYPASVLDEVKILPLGKEISAVGLYSFKNGEPEIKSCKDLPYFLSEMSKDQMVVDLTLHAKILLWTWDFSWFSINRSPWLFCCQVQFSLKP